MKKHLIILSLSMILCIESFSQIIYEKGYFIDDSNQKIECLIKNIGWKFNPTRFEYMLTQNSITQKASIETVKEFGINGVSKYVRSTVKIDRSEDNINALSSEKNPIFLEEQLFLKVLIEGKATLYLYEYGNLKRFFYDVDDSDINQLVYKRYLVGHSMGQNNYFMQQLNNDLKCQDIMVDDTEQLTYTKRSLERFFIKYNECSSSGHIHYDSKQKQDLFNLSFRPGLNYNSLSIQNPFLEYIQEIDFDNKLSFRFGIEAEFILPFNKNKWGIIIEPTFFQYYYSEKTIEALKVSGGILEAKAYYHTIELPLGVRHYFFLNDKSKIFADISYIFDYNKNSVIEFKRIDGSVLESLEVNTRRNIGLGIGYKYSDKYSLSIRYQTNQEIIGDYLYWNSDYKTCSVIFGYSLN